MNVNYAKFQKKFDGTRNISKELPSCPGVKCPISGERHGDSTGATRGRVSFTADAVEIGGVCALSHNIQYGGLN